MATPTALTVAAVSAAAYSAYHWWYGSADPGPAASTKYQLEKHYQALLHKHVGGEREVGCRYGYVDVLTDDAIYEVKIWNAYKSACGQLVAYSKCFPNRRKVMVLFGRPYKDRVKKREIVSLLKSEGIEVWMYDQDDILFEL